MSFEQGFPSRVSQAEAQSQDCRRKFVSASSNMDAITDGASADRYGLSRFGAVDTTGQPTLDPEEDVAAIFPDVGLRLGDNAATSAGTLHITSTYVADEPRRCLQINRLDCVCITGASYGSANVNLKATL